MEIDELFDRPDGELLFITRIRSAYQEEGDAGVQKILAEIESRHGIDGGDLRELAAFILR